MSASRPQTSLTPGVLVQSETQGERAWTFRCLVGSGDDARTIDLSLAYVDYEYWCHGRLAPELVARRLIEVLVDRRAPAVVPMPVQAGAGVAGAGAGQPVRGASTVDGVTRFDASTARRWIRDLDEELAARL